MKHPMLEALSANIKPGVWYVRRIRPQAGGTDEKYWIVTNPSAVMDKFRVGEMPKREELGRTFPRHRWNAALAWAVERSQGGRLPMAAPPRPVVPTGGLPAGPSAYFTPGPEHQGGVGPRWYDSPELGQVQYPEQSGGAVTFGEE